MSPKRAPLLDMQDGLLQAGEPAGALRSRAPCSEVVRVPPGALRDGISGKADKSALRVDGGTPKGNSGQLVRRYAPNGLSLTRAGPIPRRPFWLCYRIVYNL